MLERTLQNAVIEMAQWLGWRVHHDLPSQSATGQWRTAVSGDIGFPDLVLAKADRVLFVELKSDDGRLTRQQILWMAVLQAATVDCGNVDYQLWRPADWLNGTIETMLQ